MTTAWAQDIPASGRADPEQMDRVIEAIIQTGGSYAVIESPEAQVDWAALTDHLNDTTLEALYANGIELPIDIKLYGYAERDKAMLVYYHRADFNGILTVALNSKANFIPNLRVYDRHNQRINQNRQTPMSHLYEIQFTVRRGEHYRIDITPEFYMARRDLVT